MSHRYIDHGDRDASRLVPVVDVPTADRPFTTRTFTDHNDALQAHAAFTKYITGSFRATRDGWLGDRWGKYGRDATAPSAIAFDHMIEDTLNADTVWMTHEMMDLCQHAMEGFDADRPVTVDDLLIPHGFMVLPEPFYSVDIHGKKMAERAYLWRWEPDGCVIMTEADGDQPGDMAIGYTFDLNMQGIRTEPVLRITCISHIDDPDDYDDEYGITGPLLVSRGIEWGIVHTTAIPQCLIHRMVDVKGEGDSTAGWLRFFRTAQRMMAERIITSERVQARRPLRREVQRMGYDFAAPRVIELRRPTSREADPEGERVRDVEWSHRWVVRGHWRNLPDRQIWIGAYVKGPENLPLVVRERVWNWDR